jgi:hypothetical protein
MQVPALPAGTYELTAIDFPGANFFSTVVAK